MTGSPAVMEMRGISKSFPGVRALRDVSFGAAAGEVHALVGENGAGKSTLIKILSGVYRPDSGAVVINGEEAHFRHPVEALRAGISVIYQEFSLLPERTVAQNIFLGREPSRGGIIDHKAMEAETRRVLALFGSSRIEPDTLVADLDIASQQMVEIAKAISLNAKVVVMDEPTAALGPQETAQVGELIKQLKSEGIGIFLISHDIHDVFDLADRVCVMKNGQVVGTARTTDVTKDEVLGMIILGKCPPGAVPGPGAMVATAA